MAKRKSFDAISVKLCVIQYRQTLVYTNFKNDFEKLELHFFVHLYNCRIRLWRTSVRKGHTLFKRKIRTFLGNNYPGSFTWTFNKLTHVIVIRFDLTIYSLAAIVALFVLGECEFFYRDEFWAYTYREDKVHTYGCRMTFLFVLYSSNKDQVSDLWHCVNLLWLHRMFCNSSCYFDHRHYYSS